MLEDTFEHVCSIVICVAVCIAIAAAVVCFVQSYSLDEVSLEECEDISRMQQDCPSLKPMVMEAEVVRVD